MIILLGLLLLIAAVVVGAAAVLTNDGIRGPSFAAIPAVSKRSAAGQRQHRVRSADRTTKTPLTDRVSE